MLLALSSVPLMVRIIFGVVLFICLSGTNLGEGEDERLSSELVEQPEKEYYFNRNRNCLKNEL